MKTRIITTFFTAVFLVAATLSVNAQNTEQLFQNGIMKEEGEGNLPEAIEIFNSIVEDADADDALQAKALLHVGLCYEKLGKNEASGAYQKLINNFPARKNEVAIARERLSRLILAEEKAEQIPLQPKWTKIDIPTELSWSVALSPDGKELALVSDKKLWKMPLSSKLGTNIPGAPVQINTEGVEVEWTGLSWSRDGEWIAFNEYPNFKDSTENQKIYIIPSEGGNPRKIIENYRSARVINYHIGLSPKGKELAFSSVDNSEQHIFKIPTRGGKPQKLTELNAREPIYSPDGKFIAFVEDKGVGRGEGDLDLYIVPSEGGTPRKVADAEKASSPIWSPDGNMIAYHDITKSRQIFIAPLSKKNSEEKQPVSIQVPEGIEEISLLSGWTPGNKIGALMVKKQDFSLYTLPKKGGQAAKILQNTYALQPRWSKDNKKLYYITKPTEGIYQHRKWYLSFVSSDGGEGEEVFKPSQRKAKQLPFQSGNRISPDGKMLLSAAYSTEDSTDIRSSWPKAKIWKIALDGSYVKQLTHQEGDYADGSPCWSPDGGKVAFVRTKLKKGEMDPYGHAAIYTIDASGDNLKIIVDETGKWVNSLIWSSDGKMLAWMSREKGPPQTKLNMLNVYDIHKEKISKKYEVPGTNVNIEMAWSPDSKKIAFNDLEGKVIKVIDIEDGKIEDIETGLVDVKIHHLDWSPDGKRFVFGGYNGGDKEFWLLENFLPLEKLAQNNKSKEEPEGIVIKQVWNDEKVDDTGTITPDGKYLSFVDWETGDLALRNLKTGTNERLTDEGTWEEPMHFAVNNVISPNGNRIAYSWFNDKGTYDLKIIDVNAKNVSTLYATEKDEEIYPVSWLPGSSELMVQYSKKIDDSYEIYLSLMNTTGSSITHLKKFHTPSLTNLSLSKYGKFIAFDFPNPDDDGNFDINIMTKDGKNEHTVIQHPANDRVLGWIPGSDKFLFVSNRSGAYDIYAMEIVNGKIKNEPVKIVTDIGKISPVSFTEDGTLFYSNYRRNFNAFTVPVSAAGEISINKRHHLLGPAFDISWLPDGKNLVCLKYEETNGYYIPSVYNTEKNEFRPLIKKQNLVSIGYLNLSPDGKSVLFFGSEKGKEKGQLYQVDIKTGLASPVKILNEPETAITLVEWNNDGKSFFYVHNNSIIKHNILTGKEEPVLTGKKILIRADILKLHKEKHLIFVEQENENEELLKSISLESGEEKIICKFNNKWSGYGFRELVYFPPTKDFYFSFNENGSLLYRVDENGGEPEIMWDSDKTISGLSVHPNNDKLTISVHELEQEIRKIENLKQEIEKIYAKKE